jgi:hypothetical protein
MSEKAQELIAFAKEHGFEIHSRTNPEEWAETLAEGEGQCPCHHAPACPCEDAIVRITDPARGPEDQMCGCTFFVSKAYLEHYKKQPWRPAVAGKAAPDKTTQASPTPDDTKPEYVKVREVDPLTASKALEKVEIYLTGADMIKEGDLDQLNELMEQEKRNSIACSLCTDDAELVESHSRYAQTLCSQGRPGCEDELSRLLAETVGIIDENFMVAGFEREGAAIPPAVKKAKKTNAWLEFSHEIGRNPLLEGTAQKYKMKVAAGIYRGEYKTIEEAMTAIPLPTTFS